MAGLRSAASRSAASSAGSSAASGTTGIRYELRAAGKLGGGELAAVDKATGRDVGHIEWGSNRDVQGVHVDPTHQRRGIATQLYKRASRAAGAPLHHSANRTDAGDAFARAAGGPLPPRSSMFRR